MDLTGATTLPELATRLRDQLWRDLEHQDFDGVRVLRELARHRGVTAELSAPTVFAAAVGHTDDVPPELPLTWLGDQVYALSQTRRRCSTTRSSRAPTASPTTGTRWTTSSPTASSTRCSPPTGRCCAA
ncbi:hypothetical protein [Salinispora arenicola]|uniref:hypothetical protein n=1 Tax=Salinispora arenicola TaxID=168697 RepID=UPI0016ABF724|nr:hypothetical protein [Salinispora arenicola]NIL64979.1 hypothetical protein [Salinispora arenicola]